MVEWPTAVNRKLGGGGDFTAAHRYSTAAAEEDQKNRIAIQTHFWNTSTVRRPTNWDSYLIGTNDLLQTVARMIREVDGNKPLLLLNSNTVYCSSILSNRIKRTYRRLQNVFINKIKCKSIFTATEARFQPDVPTYNPPPDPRLSFPLNADCAGHHYTRHLSFVSDFTLPESLPSNFIYAYSWIFSFVY
jgi:hypothetical protein